MKRAMIVSFVVLFCITAPALAQSFAGVAHDSTASTGGTHHAVQHAAHKTVSLKVGGRSTIVSNEQR